MARAWEASPDARPLSDGDDDLNEQVEIGLAQKNASLKPLAVVNSGIAAVVPAYLLREILYCDELVKERARIADTLPPQ